MTSGRDLGEGVENNYRKIDQSSLDQEELLKGKEWIRLEM